MPVEESKIVLLFKEIQYGNKAAFDELFASYYDKLLSFAKQYVKLESAEEIVSELFVRLWLKKDRLANVLRPEVYLYICVKNACLNLIRSDQKRGRLFATENAEYEVDQVASVGGLEDKELEKLLGTAVAALPAQRRLVFKLIKEQGLKSNAVAQILGISVRTVENQLYKALKTLADAISSYLGYHPQAKIQRKQVVSKLSSIFF